MTKSIEIAGKGPITKASNFANTLPEVRRLILANKKQGKG